MKLTTSLALVAANTLALVHAQNSSSPTVNLGYAQYRGTVNASLGVTTYFGIRYAQPPVGELRFRAPLDIERNNNYSSGSVIDATTQGPICIQGTPSWNNASGIPSVQPGSEDCLLLDVLTPETPSGSNLPVLVQIHGGGYAAGNSESYPGYALVNQSQGGLIYISIQYRLNAFGFLNSAEVRQNGNGNAGLLDQRSALNWIQRNVRSFGGDPSKVTIIGGSAGGGSVMNQMILFGGEPNPPFRAVISEYPWCMYHPSTAEAALSVLLTNLFLLPGQPFHNQTTLDTQYRQVLTAANCSDIQCLRTISSQQLDIASQSAQLTGYSSQPMDYGYGDFYYGPSVDGEYVRDLPSNEFKQGHFSKVPLLVDHDGYEGESL